MTSPAPIPTTLPEVAQLAVQNREDIATLIRLMGQVNDSVQLLAQHQAGTHDRLAGQITDVVQQFAQHQAGAHDRLVSALADLQQQDRANIDALVAGLERTNAAVAELAAGLKQTNDVVAELAQNQAEQRNATAELRATVADLAAGLERTNAVVADLAAGLEQTNATVARLVAGQERNNAAIAELRATVAELAAGLKQTNAIVAELVAGQERNSNAIAELRAAVADLVRSQQELRADIAAVSGRLANITGTRYEKHAAQSTPRRVRRLFGLRDVTIAHTDWEPGSLMVSIRDSDLITDEEADDVGHIDIILTGCDDTNDIVLIAAEISTTIQDGDVARAHRRAEIIARASGRSVHPAVIGQSAESYAQTLADHRSVAVITVPPPIPE